jgi:hypothetical protein
MYDNRLFDHKEVPTELLDCFEEVAGPECGKSWVRVVDAETVPNPGGGNKKASISRRIGQSSVFRTGQSKQNTTLDWQPTCAHTDAPPVPAIVLDSFCGSGTTLLEARRLGRIGLGFDLSYTYLRENAAVRLGHDKLAAWGKARTAPNGNGANGYHELPLFSIKETV